jgi:hypothetical protein
MKWICAFLSLLIMGRPAGTVLAQQGTAVQLPTYSFFSTSTTVSVPDRGSVYMGGVKRARTGMNEFGTPLLPTRPFRNRAIGSERSASGVSVSVRIHDFEAMDEFLLNQPTAFNTRRRVAGGDVWMRRVADAQTGSARPATLSVAEARQQHLAEEKTKGEEALDFFQRGMTAEAAGKANVARIYYRMAARRADGDLKDRVLARIQAVSNLEGTSAVAASGP